MIAGLCPTTEANLGDGIFPADRFLAAKGAIAIGSDSHITVSPAEDLRQLEYSQRLRDRARNVLAGGPGQSTGRRLFDAALERRRQVHGAAGRRASRRAFAPISACSMPTIPPLSAARAMTSSIPGSSPAAMLA